MEAEAIFKICNTAAPIGWLLMIFVPRWKWTRLIVLSGLYPLLLGIVYLALIVIFFGESAGDFNSLAGVAKLFENPYALTAGWIHYLAFDMFIGAWEVKDSQKHGISHLLVLPCLGLTFIFGPIGLILYFIIKYFKTKKLLVDA